MMILRMLIWITMMRRGVKRRVQTKVKSVAGFGQKHEERVDLGMRNMRKEKAVGGLGKTSTSCIDSRPEKQPKHGKWKSAGERGCIWFV